MIFIVEWARTADGGRVRVGVGRVRFQWGAYASSGGAYASTRGRVRLVGGRVGVAWVSLDFGLVILESERCILVTN
jgi:hypothetical protein